MYAAEDRDLSEKWEKCSQGHGEEFSKGWCRSLGTAGFVSLAVGGLAGVHCDPAPHALAARIL